MVQYRKFRNTDPPGLVEIWNEAFVGHGGVCLPNSTLLERCVFSKLYFDPAGLIIAEDNGSPVGFIHAGFGAQGAGPLLENKTGVICLMGVRPSHRRRGIGSELLQRGENFLREQGATVVYAGPHVPRDPFYLGLYGGSDLPGFLASQPEAQPFLTKHGYRVDQEILIFRRPVRGGLRLGDPRVATYRQQLELRVAAHKIFSGWWQECVLGSVEPLEFSLVDKASNERWVKALVWYMEGFGDSKQRLVGIVNLEVAEGRRRQGLGKFFLCLLMRALEEEFFEGVEIQVSKDNIPGVQLCRSAGFGQVDTGRVYVKNI